MEAHHKLIIILGIVAVYAIYSVLWVNLQWWM